MPSYKLKGHPITVIIDVSDQCQRLADALDGKVSVNKIKVTIAAICQDLYMDFVEMLGTATASKRYTGRTISTLSGRFLNPSLESTGGYATLPEGTYLAIGWWDRGIAAADTEARPVTHYVTPALELGSSKAQGMVDGLSYQRIKTWVEVRGLASGGQSLSSVASAIWKNIMTYGVAPTRILTAVIRDYTRKVERSMASAIDDVVSRIV